MEAMSSNLEDYLETIFSLEAQHSEARAKDIADAMGVQRASVHSRSSPCAASSTTSLTMQ